MLDNQHGCIKWSWFSGDADRLPPNHFCVRAPDARLAFTSERFNDPGYAQLAREPTCASARSGPDDDAMGAFGFLLDAHKWTNLQVRLREFMPVGVRPLIVPVTYAARGRAMNGDFSILNFDPHEHERGVARRADGVLRNVSGVLHQQGRVTIDADLTEGELLELGWNGQAGRDIIGAGVCAVPAAEPEASASNRPWSSERRRARDRAARPRVGGRHPHAAAGSRRHPAAAVERARHLPRPADRHAAADADTIDDGVRDAVILEVSEEALHGFQYPERLIEPALGGPDTTERAFVNVRFRLLRLADGRGLHDDPRPRCATTRRPRAGCSVSLAPTVAIGGDCPVVGGGGYTGFEHHLYRIEIADTRRRHGALQVVAVERRPRRSRPLRRHRDAAARDHRRRPRGDRASRACRLLPRGAAVRRARGHLERRLRRDGHAQRRPRPGAGRRRRRSARCPSTTDSVFFRLWNGIADDRRVHQRRALRSSCATASGSCSTPPAAGNYRPGDYWTFPVRAGEIANPQSSSTTSRRSASSTTACRWPRSTGPARPTPTISGTIEDSYRRRWPVSQ